MQKCTKCQEPVTDPKYKTCLDCRLKKREYDVRWRELRVKNGKCVRCGEVTSGRTCSSCKEYEKNWAQETKKYHELNLLCNSCGKQRDDTQFKYCLSCRKEDKKRKDLLIDKKLCISCGKPVKNDLIRCSFCLDRISLQKKNRRLVRIEKGLCGRCGVETTNDNWCDGCKEKFRNYHSLLRIDAITSYNAICNCCKLTTFDFLVIDHISSEVKKKYPFSGSKLYRWLKKNNYPKGFQVLCFNCNTGKGQEKYCPHSELFVSKPMTKNRKRYLKNKKLIFAHYGKSCKCCGEDNLCFLNIDHISGGGRQHRKETNSIFSLYPWLIKNDFPDGFQTLCANCNWGKYLNGECPHQKGYFLNQEKFASNLPILS